MKRFLSILLAVMLVFSLTACGGSPEADAPAADAPAADAPAADAPATDAPAADAPAGGKDPSEVQLAGLVFSDDQFMNNLLRGYEEAAAEFGCEVNLQNVAQDQAREAELINTFISQQYDGIAIAPFSKEGSVPTLKLAADAGILIATTNMNLADGAAPFISGGYTSDDRDNGNKMGTYAAEWLAENVDGKINLGIVHFDHSQPDQSGNRWKGFVEALDVSGIEYEIVDSQANAQGDPLGLTSNMITAHPDMNVIFCCNEGSTIAGAQAVTAAGKAGQIFVFGYDSSDQTSTMIFEEGNPLVGVVTQDPYTMGYNAMTLLCRSIVNGEDISEFAGTTLPVPGEVLTKDNPDGVNAWRTANGFPTL